MIYLVKNKRTKREYEVDQKTYDALDKKKFTLVHSYDETVKQKIIIPEEIVTKQMKGGVSKFKERLAEKQAEQNADNQTENTND